MSKECIDKRQLKALLKAQFIIDLYGTTNLLGNMGGKGKRRRFPPMAIIAIYFFMIGAVSAPVIAKLDSIFLGQFFLFTMAMIFVAITVLIEYANLLLTPDDYAIISPHPVNSKTFFATKMLNTIIYISSLSLILALVPAIVNAVKYNNVFLAPVTILAVICGSLATTMFLITFYTLMLRISSRDKMNRVLSYAQLLFLFIFYMAFLVLPRSTGSLSNIDLLPYESSWLYALPSAWYASWITSFTDSATTTDFSAALFGIVVLAGLYYIGQSRLSLRYASTLGDMVDEQKMVEGAKRSSFVSSMIAYLASPEDLAVWKLIGVQFKHDNRFKVSVLVLIPLIVIYLVLGMMEGTTLTDPFMVSVTGTGKPNYLIYIAIAMLPYMAVINTSYSTSYRASWIFFALPVERAKLAIACKRFALIFICLPYLIFLCLIFAFYFDNVFHAVLHSVTLLLLCMVVLTLVTIVKPTIPFSEPVQAGTRMATMMVSFLIPVPLVVIPLAIIAKTGYGGVITYLLIEGALITINLLLLTLQKPLLQSRLDNREMLET